MPEISERIAALLADRYRIERELGQGGMATVYLAHDVRHERQVALKVLRPELGAVLGPDRFLAEIKITARLDHPHILVLIDSGASDGFLYYVLPFVRGESLRDLLRREKQLSVEQALSITKQVGSALDYAHRHGVVHRDIKPENILLQEGEAMLADFGIALAVKEAGGNRLTETGLSLGTPQYMSPEQATGDRTLDARSDLYSLAAVLYEMLVGEPPMTGPTVQAVIAKLLTEQPTRIRTVRNSVPPGIDEAVAKALSKVPADRFGSAGEFVRALEAGRTTGAIAVEPSRPRRARAALLIGGVAVVAAAGALLANGFLKTRDTSATLRDRTQLTFNGATTAPALSGDGKQLAYFVRDCSRTPCSQAVTVQDVGGTTTRRILEGVHAGYGIEWSPDRRNLIVTGTIGTRFGAFLLSALGGPPRLLTAGAATFYAGGDSLLIGPSNAAPPYVVRVAGIDGTVRDSVMVPGPGQLLATLASVPGADRFVALVIQAPHGLWQVLDRRGKILDHLVNSCTCGGTASRDAIWMTRAGPTAAEAVVRVAIDPRSGRFAARQDTIYSGQFTGVSVTADGTQMAVDDGSYDFSVQALPFADLMRGRLPGAPLLKASSNVGASVSPDGARLLVQRTVPTAAGSSERRLSVMPFEGGAETPVAAIGRVQFAFWADSVSAAIGGQTPQGLHLAVLDVRTGTPRNPLDLADSTVRSAEPLPDGWSWIPPQSDRVIVARGGRRLEIPRPGWYQALNGLAVSPDGSRLLMNGWGGTTADSIRVSVAPTSGGEPVPWVTMFADGSTAYWLDDRTILLSIWSGEETASLFRVQGPGLIQPLGTIPHPASGVSVSADLKRVALRWRDYRGDAWRYGVVKR